MRRMDVDRQKLGRGCIQGRGWLLPGPEFQAELGVARVHRGWLRMVINLASAETLWTTSVMLHICRTVRRAHSPGCLPFICCFAHFRCC